MQEDYFESIHPPDLIHFDGRRTPDSTCSSLSSPENSPLPRQKQGDIISPATTRTVVLVNSTIPLPFDEHTPRGDELKIDLLSQQYEEEDEPGRIINCASPRSNDFQRKSINNRECEEKKSETPSLFDETRQTKDFITPTFPRESDDFEDLALAPTDEKMCISLKNPRQTDSGPPRSAEVEQQGKLGSNVSPNNKTGSFEDERFENPSFTPDKKKEDTSMSMFQSLANVTMSAALHIENLILGPSDPPATSEQPSWYAENKDARNEIFSSMASPADKFNPDSVVETPNTSRLWTEAGASPDVWRAEKDMLEKYNTSSQSPNESIEYTPVKTSAVVRRSFGAETMTSAFEEDAPADESGRALSGGSQTPVALNAPADELRTSQRRPIDPPPSCAEGALGEKLEDKEESLMERPIRDCTLAGVAANASNSEVGNSRRKPRSPHLDTSTKKPDSETLKPYSLSIYTGEQPLDERRQDKNSPSRFPGKGEIPDDEPAALVPKKVIEPADIGVLETVRDLQQGPVVLEQSASGKMNDECEEPPELRRAINSASPIMHIPSPSTDCRAKQISRAEDGYASDGTDNLLGSLQVLMDDLDDMARKRGIRTKPDQSSSFHSCVSSVHDGLNSSLLSTRGYASPSKSVDTLQDGLPFRINMLNNDLGIPIGDVIISLVNEEDADKSWVARVNEAVWRCRIVRRNCDTKWLKGKLKKDRDSSGLDKSSSFAYSGDSQLLEKSIQEIQAAAIQHLKYDELSDAVYLYIEILDRYMSYIPTMQALPDSNHKLRHLGVYIGIAKYDLGVINMLQGKFGIACGLFEKAATMLAHEKSIDQLAIRNKIATCLIAQHEFQKAQKILREVYLLARERTGSLPDRRQFAEILNNLACIHYLLNEYKESFVAFTQSLDIQLSLSDDALYLGSKFSSQSSAMNVAIVRANVGFLALISRDIPTARMAFESSLKTQALLLRDAHVSLVSAMEHLAIIHLFDNSKDKALQLLRRVLHMQVDTFGASDHRCLLSQKKIKSIEADNSGERLILALAAVPDTNEGAKVATEAHGGGKTIASFWSSLNQEFYSPKRELVPF